MKIVVDKKYTFLGDVIASLPRLMDEGQGETVYDSRNRVVHFSHNGLSLMVKRFKRVNAIQKVVYSFFRKTKAERAFLFAEEFAKRGIDTPQRVAYIEEKHAGLFDTGYFVSIEAQGTETSLLLREVQDYPKDLAEAVAQQVVFMHSKGILHGDLNLSNFLCTEQNGHYHFCMIDINRSHFREGLPTDEECLKNLVRITHRRDLYDYIVRSYARQRGWDETQTATRALQLLDRFEHRF
jgi:tRNA A-37 threonylcarbamoyl transferase component Bud32